MQSGRGSKVETEGFGSRGGWKVSETIKPGQSSRICTSQTAFWSDKSVFLSEVLAKPFRRYDTLRAKSESFFHQNEHHMSTLDTSTPQKSLVSRATTAGLFIALASAIFGLVFYVTGWDIDSMTNSGLNWFKNVTMIAITYYFIHVAVRQHRQIDRGGYLTVGNGIGLGTLAGVVAGVVGAIWAYIFFTFIAPGMMDTIKEISLQQMQEQGQSAEQAEQAMEMMSFFFSSTFFTIIVIFMSVLFGFLAGLISGLILKKDKPYL